MTDGIAKVADYLEKSSNSKDFKMEHNTGGGDLVITVHDKNNITKVMQWLRDDPMTCFELLLDVCGVDYLGRQEPRFQVVYHLLSIRHNWRLRIKLNLNDAENLPSVSHIFESAGWYEREVYDMYGIVFDHHPDLRRILTDYDFIGHPLRKDFPLSGHVQVYYDIETQQVEKQPLKLTQEFRNFDFNTPWDSVRQKVADAVAHDSSNTNNDQT